MNTERREKIQHLINQLVELEADVTTLGDTEREAYDNLPEGLQESDRGQAIDDAANMLENAANTLNQAITELEDAIN
jgi:predicted RNase H-like HicB family nuclease